MINSEFTMININKLIRSKRKTLSLEINENAEIIVRAPLKLSEETIKEFILEKRSWIETKIQQVEKKRPVKKTFCEGDEILYLGKKYAMTYSNDLPNLMLSDKFYVPEKYNGQTKNYFRKWFYSRAKIVFPNRVAYFAELMNLQPGKIKLSNAAKRWGSCSRKNNINLSWRLIMAPVEILDYVIVHELTHVVHKNHSVKFWDLVEAYLPDFKSRRKWLRNYGHELNI